MRNRYALLAAVLMLGSCSQPRPVVAGGDPVRGPAAIGRYGCGSCHVIGGIRTARGQVGPPLTGIRDRMYVGGSLHNNPNNMMHWIRHPREVNSRTAMPDLNVTEQDARDIAAYLYSR